MEEIEPTRTEPSRIEPNRAESNGDADRGGKSTETRKAQIRSKEEGARRRKHEGKGQGGKCRIASFEKEPVVKP